MRDWARVVLALDPHRVALHDPILTGRVGICMRVVEGLDVRVTEDKASLRGQDIHGCCCGCVSALPKQYQRYGDCNQEEPSSTIPSCRHHHNLVIASTTANIPVVRLRDP